MQGRGDSEPRRRGVARIKEMLAAGLTVAWDRTACRMASTRSEPRTSCKSRLSSAMPPQLSVPPEIDAALAAIRHSAASVMGSKGTA